MMIFRSVQSLFITYTLIVVAGITIPLTYSGYVLMNDIIYQSGTEILKGNLDSLLQPVTRRYDRLHRIGLEDSETHIIEIHTDALKQFSRYSYNNSGSIFVLSEDNRMILSKEFIQNELITDPAILTEIKMSREGIIDYTAQGIERLAVYQYYEPWNQTIALGIDKSELFSARNMFLRIILIVLVITLTLAAIAQLSLLKKIIHPLRQLANCADEITKDNFDKKVEGHFWGEFATVQRAFDSMRVRIKEKVARIEGQLNIIQLKEATLTEALTQLEQSEAQVRMLLDSTAEAIYGLDMEGNCTFANPSCVHLLGYKNADELLGHNMHELIHHKHPDNTRYLESECPIFHAFQAGSGAHVDSEVLWRADGTSFPAEYWSFPINHNGEVTGAVVTFLDITERKLTEEGLRRAQKMDAIGQLTGGVAHDFNNILAIILGNIELLKLQISTGDKALSRIAAIQKGAERAAKLTKQLLGFSRQQAAKSEIIDINRLIGEMDNLISRSVTPEVEVNRQVGKALWLTEIDPGDFQDALLNLIINARDAMTGHGHLTIETSNTVLDATYCSQNPDLTPGEYVQLAVSDSGEGIPHEQQEHIFEPFFTTKPHGKGTGLGLSMVFGFVKRSGGHIKVYSESGIGTTFRLYLPRAKGAEIPAEQPVKQTEPLPHGDEIILAVDDEPELLAIVVEHLEDLGYRLLTANDGKQALQQLKKEPAIDLLFSDVVMPGGINGYELAEKATTNRPELKVLLTSGYTEKAVTHNGHARFNANLLSKPYTQIELAKRVRAILDGTGAL